MNMITSANKRLDINSPSRVYGKMGNYMAQGMSIGFADEMKNTTENMTNAIPTDLDMSGSYNTSSSSSLSGDGKVMDLIIALANKTAVFNLNTKTFASATASDISTELAVIKNNNGRGKGVRT